MFGIPIHKLIIHFPVALTLIALVYDCWALYAKKPELHRTGYGLTVWAAVGAFAAVGTGLQLAEMIRVDKGAVTGHAGFAIASTIVLVSLAGGYLGYVESPVRWESAQGESSKTYFGPDLAHDLGLWPR